MGSAVCSLTSYVCLCLCVFRRYVCDRSWAVRCATRAESAQGKVAAAHVHDANPSL
jgi:hypothetical protein